MRKENGMGHIALIIWILIIILLVAGGIYLGIKLIKDNIIENLTTDMLLVQGKIRVIGEENSMNSEEHELQGKKVADNLEDEIIKSLLEKEVIKQDEEDFDKYYIIDSETLTNLGLESNLKDEYYIVSYASYEIIYTKGIQIDKEMHYTLTDLLEHKKIQENNKQDEELNVQVNEEQ